MKKQIGFLLIVLSSTLSALDSFTPDPGSLGMGVRSMGMGSLAATLGGDSNAVFSNPAGFYPLARIHAGSFFSQFFGEFNYSQISVAQKMDQVWWGLGFIHSGLDEIPRTIEYSYGNETRLISQGTLSASQTLLGISYAQALGDFGDFYQVYGGSTLKYFSQGIDDASGSLISADWGLRFKWRNFAQDLPLMGNFFNGADYGLVFYNPLSFKLGGNLNLSQLERNIRVGVSNRVSVWLFPQSVLLGVDYDWVMGLHLGMEVNPDKLLALRAGWDAGRPSFGAGLVLNDFLRFGDEPQSFEFNYAARFFEPELGGLTHFFGMSYLGASYSEIPLISSPQSPANSSTPTVDIRGLAKPGDEIKVYEGPSMKTQVFADDQGLWNVSSLRLKPGLNVITVTAQTPGLIESPRSQPLRVIYKTDYLEPEVQVIRTHLDLIVTAKVQEGIDELIVALPNGQKISMKYFDMDQNWQAYWQLPAEYQEQPFEIQVQGRDRDGQVTPAKKIKVDISIVP